MNKLALIIEDDEDLSAIFAEAINAAGFEVEKISDGIKAEERLNETVPYLIILDMYLPHISGETLMKKIKSEERLKDAIVIITTADARLAEMYQNVADFVMVKPISYVQLRDLTARLQPKK